MLTMHVGLLNSAGFVLPSDHRCIAQHMTSNDRMGMRFGRESLTIVE
jgi:hypothetical protein